MFSVWSFCIFCEWEELRIDQLVGYLIMLLGTMIYNEVKIINKNYFKLFAYKKYWFYSVFKEVKQNFILKIFKCLINYYDLMILNINKIIISVNFLKLFF